MSAQEITRSEYCAKAIAETFRGDGELFISAIGLMPTLGSRLAKLTFEPGLMMTDGIAPLIANCPPIGPVAEEDKVIEGWLPYRAVFDILWTGRRHVMMGATQIDRYGNQNIVCIGDPRKPKAQLLGMRGGPGNTLCHPTSYWIPNHSTKVFVPKVDVVSGVGYDRARELGPLTARFHEIRRVVSNLGVFDFKTPDNRMRIASVHPGVSVADVVEATGFELVIDDDVPQTAAPSDADLVIIRELDAKGLAAMEIRR